VRREGKRVPAQGNSLSKGSMFPGSIATTVGRSRTMWVKKRRQAETEERLNRRMCRDQTLK
jgi:hypothetical protein